MREGFFRPFFSFLQRPLWNSMRKSKEIRQDIKKRIVDLHKSGPSLGAISRCLKEARSSVQTIVRKYNQHGNVRPSYRSGRRWVVCPRDEQALFQNVILKQHLKKSARKLKLGWIWVFQMDNDPKHTAKLVRKRLEDNKLSVLKCHHTTFQLLCNYVHVCPRSV